MSADHFYWPNALILTYKPKDATNRERGLRLFCTQARSSWLLQIRAPMTLGPSGYGREGKDFIIAGAPLDVAALRALRDAINVLLTDAEGELPRTEER